MLVRVGGCVGAFASPMKRRRQWGLALDVLGSWLESVGQRVGDPGGKPSPIEALPSLFAVAVALFGSAPSRLCSHLWLREASPSCLGAEDGNQRQSHLTKLCPGQLLFAGMS